MEDDSAEFLKSLFKSYILNIKLVSEIVKLSSSLYLHNLASLKFQAELGLLLGSLFSSELYCCYHSLSISWFII